MWACLVIISATSCHRELIYCKCTGVLDSPYWEISVDKFKKKKFTFNFISINHQVILIIIISQIIIMLIYLFKKDVSIDCNK